VQKLGRIFGNGIWPAGLALAALLALLNVRGYHELSCLSPDYQSKSPDLGHMLSSNAISAVLLFGFVWGAIIQQCLAYFLHPAEGANLSLKPTVVVLWSWCAVATIGALLIRAWPCSYS
jgi:hypothetical protein